MLKLAPGLGALPAAGRALALIIGMATSTAALAQVPPAFVGNWNASWQTDKQSFDARMTVTASGGTWQTSTQNRNNPCAGREVPMKVQDATETSVSFVLQFSEVIPGCQNVNVTLQAGPNGAISGTRSKFELTVTKR